MTNAALLVEDNSSHAGLIGDELEAVLEGWTLDVVPTLAEARRRMVGCDYELFVLDFMLPDGDGIELLREIRAGGRDVPVLFVTTASSAQLAVDAMRLGADDYIVKEEGYLAMLPHRLQEVLARRRLTAERTALEERLTRAERAATLGYLASGLAHHINNPLSTIRTFLQLLPTHVEDPDFRTRYLDMAVAESERIRDLVKDIMRAATVPAEGNEVHDFAEILSRAEEGIAAELKAKSIVCRHALPAELPPVRVHGEAAMCLFLSLLQNAVRFSPEGSHIEVRAEVDWPANRLVTLVTDQGPGVPPEHRTKIFEPFFSTAVNGLGMGLFVASRIADLQNIQLTLDPQVPAGAAFRVGLPLAGGPAAKAAAANGR